MSTFADLACVQAGAVTLRCDPRRERIVGDPVDAASEHGRAVDHERERGAGGVGRGVERDGAEPDAAAPGVDRLAGVHERDLEQVQRLFAVGVRPPAPDATGGDARRCVTAGDLDVSPRHIDAIGVAEPDDSSRWCRAGRDDDQIDGSVVVVVDVGCRADRDQTIGAPPVDRNGPPHPGRRQPGTPVPPPAAGHLAEVVERAPERRRRPVTLALSQLVAVPGRRQRRSRQFVVAVDQSRGDVEAVRAMHVGRGSDHLAVEA